MSLLHRRSRLHTATALVAALAIATIAHRASAESALDRSISASRSTSDDVAEAVARFGIPASWIRAVMRVESGNDPHAMSPKGAMGLMQIMPSTWDELRFRYRPGANAYDSHDNIMAGSAYLRVHDRYGSPGFLAAYNAGPGRYEDHLATGRPLPEETRHYVGMLLPLLGDQPSIATESARSIASAWTDAPLFIGQPIDRRSSARSSAQASPDHDPGAFAPHADSLFVPVSAQGGTR